MHIQDFTAAFFDNLHCPVKWNCLSALKKLNTLKNLGNLTERFIITIAAATIIRASIFCMPDTILLCVTHFSAFNPDNECSDS